MTRIVKSTVSNNIIKSNTSKRAISSVDSPVIVKSTVLTKIIKSNPQVKTANSKIGGALDTSRFRWHKTPTPATNGAQKVFTLPDGESYVSGLLEVFLDGLLQTKGTDYTETTSTTFTFVSAPDSDETLTINYIKQ